MNRRIEIIRIINNLMLVYIVSNLLLISVDIPMGKGLFVSSITLMVYVLLSELIQGFVTNLITFMAAHIVGGFAMGLLSDVITRAVGPKLSGESANIMLVIRAFFLLIIAILAIYSRVDGKARFNPIIAEGFLFPVLYVFCQIVKIEEAELMLLAGEMIWGILCIIYYNSKQTIGTLRVFKDRAFVPYEAIHRTNSFMLRISVVFVAILMLIATAFDYGREIVDFLKMNIIRFLRWFFSHFDFTPEEEFGYTEKEPVSGSGGSIIPLDYQDDSIWHEIWQALFWIIASIVTVVIIFIAIKLIKEFYKLFNSSGKSIRDRLSRDKVEYLSPFNERKKLDGEAREKDTLTLRKRLTWAGRVRALFINYIRSGNNYSETRMSHTPMELERTSTGKEAAYELYNKARYSSAQITQEDFREMKKKCR